MKQQNKFIIIIPSFNNESWVEYNIASILNQTYCNYRVFYIDDASTDNTYNKVKSIIGDQLNWTIIKNKENRGAMYNYFHNLQSYIEDPNEIVIHLDGDDWLYDETVLDKINNFYNEKNCWMTYGGFIVWNGHNEESTLPYPQSTPHPEFVHDYKLYRQDIWRASHLRTYRSFLLQSINLKDLKCLQDGKYYWHAADLAFQYPCMEMCPKEKIQLVDFFCSVYNHSKTNQVRTHERESCDNSKYEFEIRSRKKYREGLSGEKLPLVNVYGNFREKNSVPKNFSYAYNLSDGEFDITLIEDMEILKFIKKEIIINKGIIVADIHEAPHLLSQNEVYESVKKNSHLFDLILTFDKDLLKLPNAVFRNGGYECVLNKNVHVFESGLLSDEKMYQIYQNKNKHISYITSNKTMTEMHRFRLSCAKKIIDYNLKNVDLFGVGIREIKGKIEALKDYKFSVAIENGKHDNYFTEKILDCFLTGTIPIYKGCDNIGDFFNISGIITFDTEQDLIHILNNLKEEDYYSKLEFIKENFEKAKQYAYNNDQLFEKYFKKLINV